MKERMSDFGGVNARYIINRLIDKITSGEFEVEQFDISRSDDRPKANVKMKIQGGPIDGFQTETGEERDDRFHKESGDQRSMTPDEKKVQEQIASCYL